jgi:predicted CoA-binding protein
MSITGREDAVSQDAKQALITDFVNRRTWAIVGASQDRSKFGNRILRSLRDSGYVVYPVNPKGGEIEGIKAYPSLADLPVPPEVIDLVVPPVVSEQIVREAHGLGLDRIWFQPGSESEKALAYCRDHGLQAIHHACAMVWKRQWDQ